MSVASPGLVAVVPCRTVQHGAAAARAVSAQQAADGTRTAGGAVVMARTAAGLTGGCRAVVAGGTGLAVMRCFRMGVLSVGARHARLRSDGSQRTEMTDWTGNRVDLCAAAAAAIDTTHNGQPRRTRLATQLARRTGQTRVLLVAAALRVVGADGAGHRRAGSDDG
jgi:hypothetical protein